MRSLFASVMMCVTLLASAPTPELQKAATRFQAAYSAVLKRQGVVVRTSIQWHGKNLEILGKGINTVANDEILNSSPARGLKNSGCQTLMFRNTATGGSWYSDLTK